MSLVNLVVKPSILNTNETKSRQEKFYILALAYLRAKFYTLKRKLLHTLLCNLLLVICCQITIMYGKFSTLIL